MNVYETLMKAADLIEERGWGQGTDAWCGCRTNLCLEEALAQAQGFTGANVSPREGGIWPEELGRTPAALAVKAHLGYTADQHLYEFNDPKDRTAAEVIEVLRAAAAVSLAKDAAVAAREHAAEGVSA